MYEVIYLRAGRITDPLHYSYQGVDLCDESKPWPEGFVRVQAVDRGLRVCAICMAVMAKIQREQAGGQAYRPILAR